MCALMAGLIAPLIIRMPVTFGFWLLLSGASVCVISVAVPRVLVVGLLVCAASIGVVRTSYDVLEETRAMQSVMESGHRTLDVVVVDVRQKDDRQQVIARSSRLGSNIFVTIPRYPSVGEGHGIRVACALESRLQQKASFQSYLRSRGVVAVCTPRSIEYDTQMPSTFHQAISSLRSYLTAQIARTFPSPASDLVTSILFGSVTPLPADLSKKFQHIGISHVTAASGMNVALIVMFGVGFLKMAGVSRKKRYPILAVLIVVYAALAGAVPSILRASILSLVLLCAEWSGRIAFPFRLLLLTAVAMLAWNPKLAFDLSFQLSFAGVAGLVIIAPRLNELFTRVPALIRRVSAETLSATLTTAPITIAVFGTFSLVSLLSNILILPLASALLIATACWSVLAGFASVVPPFLQTPFLFLVGLPVWLLSQTIVGVADILARIPFASVPLPIGSWGWVIIVGGYCVVGWIAWYLIDSRILTLTKSL